MAYRIPEAMLKPVKKGHEFDVDIGAILDEFNAANQGSVNWTHAAMIVQGSSQLTAKKIDALHEQTVQAVAELGDDEADGDDGGADGGDTDGGQRKRKGHKRRDLTTIIFDTELAEGDFVSDEMPATTLPDEPPKLLPKRDAFFTEPVGEARGREIFEVSTGDYVCHENDLWCNRVNVVPGVGVILPGDTQPVTADDVEVQDGELDIDMPPVQPDHTYNKSNFENPMDGDDFEEYPDPASFNDPEAEDLIQQAAPNRFSNDASVNVEPMDESHVNPVEPSDPFEYQLTLSVDQAEWTSEQTDNWFDKLVDVYSEYVDTGIPYTIDKKLEERGAEWMAKSEAALKAKNDACKLDPNCTKPYLPNPKYWPHHDHTLANKRMAASLHKCDKNRPMEEQWEEIDEILWRDHREAMRKKQLKWKRANLKKMNQRLKAYYGDNYYRVVSQTQKDLGCTRQEAVVNVIGAPTIQNFEDLPADCQTDYDEPDHFDNENDVPDHGIYDVMGGPDDAPLPSSFAETDEVSTDGPQDNAKTREYLRMCGQGLAVTEVERVTREWRQSLGPRLAEEEKREPFDIRQTIDRLDEAVNEQPLSWAQLSSKTIKSDFELCRNFAAMLQMANEAKVVIEPKSSAIGDFTVTKVPDDLREKVAGDEVSKKRVRAATLVDDKRPIEVRTPKPKKKHARKT